MPIVDLPDSALLHVLDLLEVCISLVFMNYRPYPADLSPVTADASENNSLLPQEAIEALEELGMIFKHTHERMVAEGYTIVNGKVVKLVSSQPNDPNQS